MKNSRTVIRKVSGVTFAIALSCLVTTIMLSILRSANAINIDAKKLWSVGLLSVLLFMMVSCMGFAINQYMDYKKEKGYKERERKICSDISDVKQDIVDMKESINEKSTDFKLQVSKFLQGIPDLIIPNLSEDEMRFFEDLKLSCIEYLNFAEELHDMINDQSSALCIYSDYGEYQNFTRCNLRRMSTIKRKFSDEMTRLSSGIEAKYKKCSKIIESINGNSKLKNRIIELLHPRGYDFIQDLLTLQMTNINNISKLAELKQERLDVKYRLSEESSMKIIGQLKEQELNEKQEQPRSSISDTTLNAVQQPDQTLASR